MKFICHPRVRITIQMHDVFKHSKFNATELSQLIVCCFCYFRHSIHKILIQVGFLYRQLISPSIFNTLLTSFWMNVLFSNLGEPLTVAFYVLHPICHHISCTSSHVDLILNFPGKEHCNLMICKGTVDFWIIGWIGKLFFRKYKWN